MRLEYWDRAAAAARLPLATLLGRDVRPEGFHLDPFALCRGYAAAAEGMGARLFEHSPATGLRRVAGGWRVTTRQGEVTADRVVLCQSAYPPRLLTAVARATLPVFTYIIVTAPLTGAHAEVIRAPYAVYDNRFATGYYRLLPEGRLLWGGRISTQERPRDLAGLMRRDLALVYPQLADVTVDHAWSGRMGFARHKMPLIRELAPGLWINSCFGGHGLNTTTLGGELVAAAIAEATAAGGCWRRSRHAGWAGPSARSRRRRSTAARGCRTRRAPTGTGVGRGDRLPQPDRRTGRTQDTLSARHVPARARWPRGFA